MNTAKIQYLGDLRTECTHLSSGSVIRTDAPLDNKGKGEFFSPTDLVATAYASCILTIMGIYCQEHGINMSNGTIQVTKLMESGPRRIGKLLLSIDLRGNNWDADTAEKIIRAGKACPVAKTLGDRVEVEIEIQS
jgi:putative redox protein